jgi:hypothetical protein
MSKPVDRVDKRLFLFHCSFRLVPKTGIRDANRDRRGWSLSRVFHRTAPDTLVLWTVHLIHQLDALFVYRLQQAHEDQCLLSPSNGALILFGSHVASWAVQVEKS